MENPVRNYVDENDLGYSGTNDEESSGYSSESDCEEDFVMPSNPNTGGGSSDNEDGLLSGDDEDGPFFDRMPRRADAASHGHSDSEDTPANLDGLPPFSYSDTIQLNDIADDSGALADEFAYNAATSAQFGGTSMYR